MVETLPVIEIEEANGPKSSSHTSVTSVMTFEKSSTRGLPSMRTSTNLLIFIKPWDDEVFVNLLHLLKFIQYHEEQTGTSINVVLPKDLLKSL